MLAKHLYTSYYSNNLLNKTFIMALVTVVAISMIGSQSSYADLSGEIMIGAIAPLSGDWSTNGVQNNVANKIAVEDFNAYLNNKGADWSLHLTTEDSQTVPTVSLEKIQAFNAKNIKHVIGPQTSGSLQNIKGYVDANNMLIISCCSTSPLLAIPDDSVFRLVPDDSNQAIAIAKLLDETGITTVVPVWRNDAWGVGLNDALVNSFSGSVVEGISYNPEGSEFSTEASILSDIVQDQVDNNGIDKVAVVYIGFAEAIPFFQSASSHQILNEVRWFGSDGSAKESSFINDPIALQFTQNTQFTAVVVASGQNDKSQRVESAVEAEIGVTPTAYASASYDAIWLLGLAMEETQSLDVDVLTEIIPTIADEYRGALGSLSLNNVGDLAQANYEMWTITNEWEYSGVYVATDDEIVFAETTPIPVVEEIPTTIIGEKETSKYEEDKKISKHGDKKKYGDKFYYIIFGAVIIIIGAVVIIITRKRKNESGKTEAPTDDGSGEGEADLKESEGVESDNSDGGDSNEAESDDGGDNSDEESKIATKTMNRQITVGKINEDVNVKFNCNDINGEPLKERAVTVYLNDAIAFEGVTNTSGQLTSNIPVNELGEKKFKVTTENADKPIVEGTIEFVLRDDGGDKDE